MGLINDMRGAPGFLMPTFAPVPFQAPDLSSLFKVMEWKEKMQDEIDEEKAMGLGLPVEVTNSVAQQQMIGDVETEQQSQLQAQQPQQEARVFAKLKQIL